MYPLYSAGLWLAVTTIPAVAASARVAYATSGVGTGASKKRTGMPRRDEHADHRVRKGAARVARVEADDDRQRPRASRTVARICSATAFVVRTTTARFIRAGPGADHAAEARGPEGERLLDAFAKRVDGVRVDERRELARRVGIRIIRDPGARPFDERRIAVCHVQAPRAIASASDVSYSPRAKRASSRTRPKKGRFVARGPFGPTSASSVAASDAR